MAHGHLRRSGGRGTRARRGARRAWRGAGRRRARHPPRRRRRRRRGRPGPRAAARRRRGPQARRARARGVRGRSDRRGRARRERRRRARGRRDAGGSSRAWKTSSAPSSTPPDAAVRATRRPRSPGARRSSSTTGSRPARRRRRRAGRCAPQAPERIVLAVPVAPAAWRPDAGTRSTSTSARTRSATSGRSGSSTTTSRRRPTTRSRACSRAFDGSATDGSLSLSKGDQRDERRARSVSRPTPPMSSARLWNALIEKSVALALGDVVAQLLPDALADLVGRRLARPAEVAVHLELHELVGHVDVARA